MRRFQACAVRLERISTQWLPPPGRRDGYSFSYSRGQSDRRQCCASEVCRVCCIWSVLVASCSIAGAACRGALPLRSASAPWPLHGTHLTLSVSHRPTPTSPPAGGGPSVRASGLGALLSSSAARRIRTGRAKLSSLLDLFRDSRVPHNWRPDINHYRSSMHDYYARRTAYGGVNLRVATNRPLPRGSSTPPDGPPASLGAVR